MGGLDTGVSIVGWRLRLVYGCTGECAVVS